MYALSDEFTILNNNTITPVEEKNYVLGGLLSAYGCSFDVDFGAVYIAAELRGDADRQASVDVCFIVINSSEPHIGNVSKNWINALARIFKRSISSSFKFIYFRIFTNIAYNQIRSVPI